MTEGAAERAIRHEISDADLVENFRRAKSDGNIPERDDLGRQIMGRILERTKRTQYSDQPLPKRKKDGMHYMRQDGEIATVADYLTVAVDNNHGEGTAEELILVSVEVQPGDPDNDDTVFMLQEYIDKNMVAN